MKFTDTRTVTPAVMAVCWNSDEIAALVMHDKVAAFGRATRGA